MHSVHPGYLHGHAFLVSVPRQLYSLLPCCFLLQARNEEKLKQLQNDLQDMKKHRVCYNIAHHSVVFEEVYRFCKVYKTNLGYIQYPCRHIEYNFVFRKYWEP